ncbi:MAG TPA: hypothetical protein VHU13_06165 [Solirubrobacteraceae bacterium]|jgi:D-alanyl-D-alanine carboxypeptidase|nr:hypothetical protein [Solirubrobacteraceae bacterium]
MSEERLRELEREQRRRLRAQRAQARHRRKRRLRAVSNGRLATSVAIVAALVAGGAFSVSGTGGGGRAATTGARASGHREAVRGRDASQGEHAPGAATHSRSGLPLGQPPLALTAAPPARRVQASFRHPPRVALLFDLDDGAVLWQRNATRELPIASLAKMMTALLVARALPAAKRVPISRRAVDAQGSKVGLLPLHGRVPVQTLLYGLLLPSGNDAAVALAEATAGSVRAFVARMNVEAARLGLACTRYTSPDGLDGANSSCAEDLAELASVDLAEPRIAKVAGSASAVLPFPIKGGRLYLYNNNPLLRYGYPGATGLKTGETEAAGLCLVGTAERDGVRLGVVLLHSPELGRQAEHLLDEGFAAYGLPSKPAPPVPPGR